MRPAGVLALCSIVFCIGAWLMLSGWRQPRPRLDRAMAHLRRPAAATTSATPDSQGAFISVGAFVERRASTWTRAWTQPLRLVDRSVEVHVGHLVLAALGGLMTPAVIVGGLQVLGVLSLGIWVPAALSLVCAVLAPILWHSNTMAASAAVVMRSA